MAVSAPDELDAIILARLADVREQAIIATATYIGTQLAIADLAARLGIGDCTRTAARSIRAAADAATQAAVDKAIGRYRLAEAAAEFSGRPA